MTVEGAGPDARLKGGAFDSPLPERLREAVGAMTRPAAPMGIRPEHFEVGDARRQDRHGPHAMSMSWSTSATRSYSTSAPTSCTSWRSSMRIFGSQTGDVLDLTYATDNIYLFDNETGETLTPSMVAATA